MRRESAAIEENGVKFFYLISLFGSRPWLVVRVARANSMHREKRGNKEGRGKSLRRPSGTGALLI